MPSKNLFASINYSIGFQPFGLWNITLYILLIDLNKKMLC